MSADRSRLNELELITRERALTESERTEVREIRKRIDGVEPTAPARLEGRGVPFDSASVKRDASIQGRPNEPLRPDQFFVDWLHAAAENGVPGVRRNDPSMEHGFADAYWRAKFSGKSTAETRALGEDTTSGAGAGSATIPVHTLATVIDILRANLVFSKAGITTLPVTTETSYIPQLTGDSAPQWIGEGSPASVDASPAFAPVTAATPGAVMDLITMSRALVMDSVVDLPNYIAAVIGQRFARWVEAAILNGVTSSGYAGLANNANIQTVTLATNGATPSDTTLLSKAAQAVRNKNAEPTAFLGSAATMGTLSRITGSSGYPAYFPVPDDVKDIPRYYSTVFPDTETTGTSSATSSLWCGDWSRLYNVVRTDGIELQTLTERFAEFGQVAIMAYYRGGSVATHPETFVRYKGILTTS